MKLGKCEASNDSMPSDSTFPRFQKFQEDSERSEDIINFNTEHLPAHNHIIGAVAALIGANQHCIAIGPMNEQSRVGGRCTSVLKLVLSERCSQEYRLSVAS